MDELIDVLDENGIKTGEVLTRKEIHKYGKWHKIAVIAIIDENGNILMQQRSNIKKPYPGKWDVTTAGHVMAGEDEVKTAIREVFEEIGIKIYENELKKICTYKEEIQELMDIDRHVWECYIVEKNKIEIDKIHMQSSEVQAVKLCNLTQLEKMIKDKIVVKRDIFYNELKKYLK